MNDSQPMQERKPGKVHIELLELDGSIKSLSSALETLERRLLVVLSPAPEPPEKSQPEAKTIGNTPIPPTVPISRRICNAANKLHKQLVFVQETTERLEI